MGLQIYAPISRFSKPILQLFYIKDLTNCYDEKYLRKVFYNATIGRVFYKKKWGLKRFTFIFALMKKPGKILRQAQNDKKFCLWFHFEDEMLKQVQQDLMDEEYFNVKLIT